MTNWEIILGILLGLVVNEVTDVSPWAARKLTRWAAYRWATDTEIAAGYAEEWAALIDDRPGKLLKLMTALRFTLGAASRAAPRAGMRALRMARALRVARTLQRLAIYVRVFINPKRAELNQRGFLVTAWEPDLEFKSLNGDRYIVEVKDWRHTKVDVRTMRWHETRLVLPPDDPDWKPPECRLKPKPR
ncbi:hypothetical protein ACFYPX_09260 [Micromonospora zamorensis]|uniref:hypothetical protein n=1 Tax=Micromonospora zamorensis TaxID=709883 RepID=UPI0036C9E471